MKRFERLFGPLVIAFLLLGVTHMTLSPVHRVAEELNEESQERAGHYECGTALPQGSRRASRSIRLARVERSLRSAKLRGAKLSASAFLPRPATGELAARNGFGGPLKT